MIKRLIVIFSVITLLAVGLFTSSQAGEQEIVASFENIVNMNEKIIHSYPKKTVYRGTHYETGLDEYRKEKVVYKSISYDIQKTDSLVSPYKGIIECNVVWEFGSAFGAASLAENSEPNDTSMEKKFQVIYAYQRGKWIKKILKMYSVNYGSWKSYATHQVSSELFKKGYPYLSIFPQLFLDLK